ncbi:MAG: phenylalanine--tRNA ligase subunit beta [Chloroflexi bacterium RBG_13_68_17]|nr:MAG: phenylalanine--tRNA ligase subunit beta [Chloroflexi bacterium RBG_13_68_17]
MLVPLSWLREFVETDLPPEELARRLTLAGLEVEALRFVGLPLPESTAGGHATSRRAPDTDVSGLAWERDKFVVGAVLEVLPHPAADRLVLCRLQDGQGEHTVLTGAPNLFPFKGRGALDPPLKVAYAREGARLYDGHKPGWEIMTLKRTKIRGVESFSMACSEKELGISDDHEGVVLLDADAPTGMPLADYMGDAVFDIAINPNMARNANILGVAREVAALTGAQLREPDYQVPWSGPAMAGRAAVTIENPELNPRFVLGLIEGVSIQPSPYHVQRRLRLAGMRPINNIVDATNYVMLEVGEPLHAFDYDVLIRRAGGRVPRLLTRRPRPGERLTTLDGVERELDDFTVLVADERGALSIAGVMGGAESEVGPQTVNVLLEGAAWNFINIRRTVAAQRLVSEAAYRFSRGVHPAMAERGVRRGLRLIQSLAGGRIAEGLVDAYPLPPPRPVVELTTDDVERGLGVRMEAAAIADLLRRLQFEVALDGQSLTVTAPDHRLDIGTGVVGKADLLEEIARLYGYERIPETQIADRLPPQVGNPALEIEEHVRDLLVALGLQEVVTYRLTSPEREARRLTPGLDDPGRPYVQLANPITADRVVLRHSLLASLFEVVERNARLRERMALFEIGPVYMASEGGSLPEEPRRLVIVLCGPRSLPAWQGGDRGVMDFFDVKGVITGLLDDLHIAAGRYEPVEHPSFHPGKAARLVIDDRPIGILGEVHPLVRERYDFPEVPLLAADLDLEALLASIPARHEVVPAPAFPPVLEDLAVVVDQGLLAEQVEAVIRKAGGALVSQVRLFDLFQGGQIGAGKKSLAYAITYQAPDKTLTDEEVARVRERIVRRLGEELGARLRG